MNEEPVIYTDGRYVKVTTHQFIVGKAQYLINGILNARMLLIRSSRLLPAMLIMLGLAAIVTAKLHFYSNGIANVFYIGDFLITPNRIAALLGVGLLLLGIIWLVVLHDKYAVHITTAEGEKEPLISRKRDYVKQIVDALNKALMSKSQEQFSL